MTLAYAAYLAAFAAAILLISAFASTTRAAFAGSIVFWSTACILIPRAANEIAGRVYQTQSPQDFSAQISESIKAKTQSAWFDRRKQIEAELLRKYGVSDVKQLPVTPSAQLLSEWEELTTRIQNAGFAQLYRQQERQHAVIQVAGWLAPKAAIEIVSMALAEADPQHVRDYCDKADEYRYRMTQYLNEDSFHTSQAAGRQASIEAYHVRQRRVYENMPPFAYQPPRLGWALSNVPPALAALLSWAVAAPAAALWAASRLSVV
jgi:ABC-2 type transport system permease protein